MYKKKFDEYTLDTTLRLAIWTAKELEKYTEDDMSDCYGQCFFEDRFIAINTDKMPNNNMILKTISHELFHFVSIYLRHKGIEHNEDTEEVYCYLYDFYFWNIMKWLEKEKIIQMRLLPKMVKK